MEGGRKQNFGAELDEAMEAHAQKRLEQAAAEMELQDQRRRALVSALKSGKYSQTTGTLRRGASKDKGGFCCLGVACEVAIRDGLNLSCSRQPLGNYTYGRDEGSPSTVSLPSTARAWYGFTSHDPQLLVPARVAETSDTLMEQWTPGQLVAATSLNDVHKLTLPQIGECFQYTFLRGEWEAEHGAAEA